MMTSQPYPGLRPFECDEADIFFGREEQTDELLSRLHTTRFLAIVGASGCGKSSLVRAGMIPALETGFMAAAGSRWQFVLLRPGSHPMRRLATALVEQAALQPEGMERTDALGFLHATLRRGPLGLVDALRHTPLPPHTNLLILVDQFEEIFRFRREGDRDEADAFVALLLASARQRDMPIYIAMTMRSDFIGNCALFNGLPEALNQSQYLTPRLTREQQRMAIIGPARVFGGDVEPELVNALLNEMGPDPDQLPLMQHLLMRLWSVTAPSHGAAPGLEAMAAAGRLLTMRDCEAVGSLRQALSNHLNEAFDELDNRQQSIAEILFRRLSERGAEQRDIRRPTAAAEVVELTGATLEELVTIVEIFRAPERSFLVPRQPEIVYPDTVLDITHESLIRQWDRLRGWAKEEARSAETYRLLERAAQRNEEGDGGFYRTPELETALTWRERERPSPVWARRYGGDFELAMHFLEASEQEHRVEEARAEDRRLKALRRTRLQAWAGAIATILLLGVIGWHYFAHYALHRTYCRDFSKQWGKIVPLGELPESAVAHRPWTIRLTSKGWSSDIQTVEVIDANHQLTPKNPIGTYLAAAAATQQEKECRYEFVFDRDGRVVYEVAFDRFGRMVWGAMHAPHAEAEGIQPASTKAMYLGADGYPQPQGQSRAEFVEIGYDTNGFEAELRYADQEGRPMPGPDNAFGQRREYDGKGREIRRTSLNMQEKPMIDEAGNAGWEAHYDADGNIDEVWYFDTRNEPTLLNAGYSRTRHSYDQWGRVTEQRFFNLRDEPAVDEQTGAHWITWHYDDRGNATSIRMYDTADKPIVAGKNSFAFPAHKEQATFSEKNRPVTIAYFGQNEDPLTGPQGWQNFRIEYDQHGFANATSWFDQEGRPVNTSSTGAHRWARVNNAFGQPVEERFFDTAGKPVATSDGGYHLRRNEYDKAGNWTVQAYFDVEDLPVAGKTSGTHRIAYTYDRFRHPLLTEHFDTKGKPVENRQGFHRLVSTYDDYGALTSERWYDKNEQPIAGPDGVHHFSYEYDRRGLMSRAVRYDAAGHPAVDGQGRHETQLSHNDKRQQTKWQAFGLNGKPAEDEDGNHQVDTEYDERGREIRSTRLRADGRPNWNRELGIATRTQRWDRENRWIEQAYYDVKDRLALGPYGYAKKIVAYSADGREEYHQHFGANDKLVFNPLVGYAELRLRWSDDHTLLNVAFWGPDGSPIDGPHGYHRALRTKEASAPMQYFDVHNRELSSLDPEDIVSVIYLEEIFDMHQPAAKAGLHAGDVLWQYGDWSFIGALEDEDAKGTPADAILKEVWQAFLNERDQRSAMSVPVTVIRAGRPVTVVLPPLPQKEIGVSCKQRTVPMAMFEAWQTAAAAR